MEAPVATFTDNQFHSLGIGYRKIEPRLAEITTHLANNRNQPLDHQIISDAEISELGRFAVTLNPQDIAKFRTPSLRNIALTAPYMHDGSVATLEEAVDIEVYYRGIELNRPLILTPQEHADLVTFLRALASPHAQSM
jgi:cytochrome c peroxidase